MTKFNVNYRNLLFEALTHLRAAETALAAFLESPDPSEADFDDLADEVTQAGVKLRYIRIELAENEAFDVRDPGDDTLSPDD